MKTLLTKAFDLSVPVIQAPMAFVAGGALASAVSRAGGLGLIGGGYGDADWLETQFLAAGDQPVGRGFISFSVADRPELLDQVLDRGPTALFLSFADPVRGESSRATIGENRPPRVRQGAVLVLSRQGSL